ncbi:MAG TPA: 3',5'-cyclic-nucleotide phosphodiesterase, partial [Burkholderiales bacterium]|nr:3',5'-cyclic-nucleotide phosphodiesterase [Burkholderiales bacterium]
MKLRVLGCSGGIGGRHRTTSFLVDDDVLVDAGTGVGDLSLEELAQIDHVFLTHSHLDHVACIPFLLDTVGNRRTKPVLIHALEETIYTLATHLFNWKLWPDFTQIPTVGAPFMRYQPLSMGERVALGDRRFHVLPANHVVPACGYRLESTQGSLVFTGDTAECEALWEQLDGVPNLRYLIIETAFAIADKDLAAASKHLTPDSLARELTKLRSSPDILVTHLKPGEGQA